ncbi:hypothetical protein [Streptomyces sp. NPDC006879]|uniref:hypothetical protein n=1 Tax=Streptomyces sp. NPDC006879 TaxID=3364767 RepID=UPI0036AB9BFE
MSAHSELRLLPWPGPEGKPCFLSADSENGCLSRLADSTEVIQLAVSAELVAHASEVLAAGDAEAEELRLLVTDLTGALRDVLRVAESRGHRLPIREGSGARDDGEEGPHLPAAAFC